MENQAPTENFCKNTRVIQTTRVFPSDLNPLGTLFGGKLMALLDQTMSISVTRHTRQMAATASLDSLHFLRPIKENHTACITSYVTGTGKRSLEIFAKVIGEDLLTGERYLAATCFMTFVIQSCQTDHSFVMPKIIPETKEETFLCAGYEKRKINRLHGRQDSQELGTHLTLDLPFS